MFFFSTKLGICIKIGIMPCFNKNRSTHILPKLLTILNVKIISSTTKKSFVVERSFSDFYLCGIKCTNFLNIKS